MESWLKPMLCEQADVVPEGDDWIIEGKLDGWRAVTHIRPDGTVSLYGGRNGNSYSGKLPYIEEELAVVFPPDSAVDGELIGGGAGQWNDVQGVMTRGTGAHVPSAHVPALTYVVFDVLRLDGEDLRQKPWRERREALEAPKGETFFYSARAVHLRLSPCVRSTNDVHETFLKLGLEGSVCKRVTSLYVNRRSSAWVKIKPQTTAEARVIGFKPGKTGGRYEGMVGAFEVELLESGARTTVKCGVDARHREATDHPERWLDVVIEIAHHGLGATGVPRHPQFHRRRDDRAGDEPTPTPRRARVSEPKRRMRNYGAMKDEKLLRCIEELHSQTGDAYDRCMNGGSGAPAADLTAATGIATQRGLLRAAA